MLAHVLPAPGNHDLLLWPASLVMAAGVLGAFLPRRRWVRRAGQVALVAGLVATVAIYATDPARPTPSQYTLAVRLNDTSTVRSPIRLIVCGTNPDGTAAAVPATGQLVEIWMDGRTVTEGGIRTFAIDAPAGTQVISAEIVPASRIEYVPPVRSAPVGVTVASGAPPSVPLLTC
jgi:hypothetical protein